MSDHMKIDWTKADYATLKAENERLRDEQAQHIEQMEDVVKRALAERAGGLLDPDMPAQEMRLHMGEMSSQEMRTARAAIRWANTRQAARAVGVKATEIKMTPITDGLPKRNESHGEQTILTYNENVGTWDLCFYEAGWGDFDTGLSLGVTHWLDITSMWPGVINQVLGLPALTTEPAAPDQVFGNPEQLPAAPEERQEAVTDEMVDVLTMATRKYTRETLFIDEHRDLIRSALTYALAQKEKPDNA